MGINGHIILCKDYVSFEVAKLLKEKGFEEPTCGFYYDDYTEKLLVSSPSNHNGSINSIAAPSQAHVMKWLRDVHKKVINVEYIDFLEHGEVWSYSVLDRNTFHKFTEKSESFTEHSYEEACEAAIKYCLTNLI